MSWGRGGKGYFDDRRDPYDRDRRDGPRGSRDRWDRDDDYHNGPRRRSWDGGRGYGDTGGRDMDRDRDWDRGYGGGYNNRGPSNWDRNDRGGYDDRRTYGSRDYRRASYDRNGDGVDERYQTRPVDVVRTTRYADDYDRGTTRYVDTNPVVRRTTYAGDPLYNNGDTVVKRTTYADPVYTNNDVVRTTTSRPLTTSGDVVKTTTTRTVSD